ncbi:murein L,D-transpeptidase catalytic domain family protein [Chryseobacterium sp.]|uniref:murein L,D-transpeptidase catalytic domain family protein n=1 Tax=Chryseobacterium sp. TaxID=1871047 RepID=UPI0011C6FA22|nr:murein L,D-transpeptidase catalytic domain family protein [Chryseobacterium sp.]TXF76126.1 murein L,D-transpeptidase catalytic domain family protein [Chryseobacterium sp.]
MKRFLLALSATFVLSTSFYKSPETHPNKITNIPENKSPVSRTSDLKSSGNSVAEIYNSIDFSSGNILNAEVFEKAFVGFSNLKKAAKLDESANLLTVVDFSLSSTQKRLWVIDLNTKKVLYNSLVAHGKNTGDEFAKNFSNTESSLQSSMGFYITESTYTGENGYSLKLIGMDPGFNDNAYKRAVVMHGADYVSEDFIKSQHRIGRSWGCPAVPRELAQPIINTIKGKNCLFIYFPDQDYLTSSQWLKA